MQAFALVATLTVLLDPGHGEMARYRARLVLVRPDEFVAWTSPSPTLGVDEARRLLHRVTGRPAPALARVDGLDEVGAGGQS